MRWVRRQRPSQNKQHVKPRAVGSVAGIVGMMLSSLLVVGSDRAWPVALPVLLLSLWLYLWAEHVFIRPRFWAVPLFWLPISLFAFGLKGEGLLLGLPLLLIVMLWARKSYA